MSSKEQHLFETEIFCNIINVFTVTFDQFNAFLQNEIIIFCRKEQKQKLTDSKLLNGSICLVIF